MLIVPFLQHVFNYTSHFWFVKCFFANIFRFFCAFSLSASRFMHNCVHQVIVYTFLVHILIFPWGSVFYMKKQGAKILRKRLSIRLPGGKSLRQRKRNGIAERLHHTPYFPFFLLLPVATVCAGQKAEHESRSEGEMAVRLLRPLLPVSRFTAKNRY